MFDLGNTLIKFDHNISAEKIAALSGLDTGKIYDIFFDSEITKDFEKGLIPPEEFHKRAASLIGFKMSYKDFAKIWNDIFWEDEGSCALARELKGSYRLFLLSNVNKLHFEYIRNKFDIIGIFDEIILSYELGSVKPERAIYDNVIKRAGGKKEGILYIDDREDLIKEAQMLGIESVRYEGADKLRETMKVRGIL
ncbi:MAG: HAD family phosphatase [Candidatus Omnitrophota bacterium]